MRCWVAHKEAEAFAGDEVEIGLEETAIVRNIERRKGQGRRTMVDGARESGRGENRAEGGWNRAGWVQEKETANFATWTKRAPVGRREKMRHMVAREIGLKPTGTSYVSMRDPSGRNQEHDPRER